MKSTVGGWELLHTTECEFWFDIWADICSDVELSEYVQSHYKRRSYSMYTSYRVYNARECRWLSYLKNVMICSWMQAQACVVTSVGVRSWFRTVPSACCGDFKGIQYFSRRWVSLLPCDERYLKQVWMRGFQSSLTYHINSNWFLLLTRTP